MSQYELTLVLDGKTTGAKKKTVQETIERFVTVFKGKIVKFEDWGTKNLAFKIKKSQTGVFLHFILELDGGSARQLVAKLKMEDEIIRHLLVRKEK